MNQRYYPYVPWDDNPIGGSTITHDYITTDILDQSSFRGSTISREGIYGPLAQIFKWLSARDNKQLIADVRVIGVLETA